MPKIIEDLRENILMNAKQILLEEGYDKLTIRSVAKACGVASGTIYNYFPSKDMLGASVMLKDWMTAIDRMQETAGQEESLRVVLSCMYHEISAYSAIYSRTWTNSTPSKAARDGLFLFERHAQLVNQLAAILQPLFEKSDIAKPKLTAGMVSEALLREAYSGNQEEFQDLLNLTDQWADHNL